MFASFEQPPRSHGSQGGQAAVGATHSLGSSTYGGQSAYGDGHEDSTSSWQFEEDRSPDSERHTGGGEKWFRRMPSQSDASDTEDISYYRPSPFIRSQDAQSLAPGRTTSGCTTTSRETNGAEAVVAAVPERSYSSQPPSHHHSVSFPARNSSGDRCQPPTPVGRTGNGPLAPQAGMDRQLSDTRDRATRMALVVGPKPGDSPTGSVTRNNAVRAGAGYTDSVQVPGQMGSERERAPRSDVPNSMNNAPAPSNSHLDRAPSSNRTTPMPRGMPADAPVSPLSALRVRMAGTGGENSKAIINGIATPLRAPDDKRGNLQRAQQPAQGCSSGARFYANIVTKQVSTITSSSADLQKMGENVAADAPSAEHPASAQYKRSKRRSSNPGEVSSSETVVKDSAASKRRWSTPGEVASENVDKDGADLPGVDKGVGKGAVEQRRSSPHASASGRAKGEPKGYPSTTIISTEQGLERLQQQQEASRLAGRVPRPAGASTTGASEDWGTLSSLPTSGSYSQVCSVLHCVVVCCSEL